MNMQKKTYNNKKRVKRNNCKFVTSKFTRNETNWSKTNSHTHKQRQNRDGAESYLCATNKTKKKRNKNTLGRITNFWQRFVINGGRKAHFVCGAAKYDLLLADRRKQLPITELTHSHTDSL